jgi:hypothetical protein
VLPIRICPLVSATLASFWLESRYTAALAVNEPKMTVANCGVLARPMG